MSVFFVSGDDVCEHLLVSGEVILGVHGHEVEELQVSWIDVSEVPWVVEGDDGDELLIEPFDGVLRCEGIDGGGIDSCVDGSCDEDGGEGREGFFIFFHDDVGDHDGNGGLADGHDVCFCVEGFAEGDDVVDVRIEVEISKSEGDVACIFPGSDEDIEVGE